jgi:hypothetical protein
MWGPFLSAPTLSVRCAVGALAGRGLGVQPDEAAHGKPATALPATNSDCDLRDMGRKMIRRKGCGNHSARPGDVAQCTITAATRGTLHSGRAVLIGFGESFGGSFFSGTSPAGCMSKPGRAEAPVARHTLKVWHGQEGAPNEKASECRA